MNNTVNHSTESPATEVIPKARRRRFSVAYKLRMLREADACTDRHAVGALLRKEGLYASHLSQWRRQQAEGRLVQGTRDAKEREQMEAELKAARQTIGQLKRKLSHAELIIEVQKKVSLAYGHAIHDTERR